MSMRILQLALFSCLDHAAIGLRSPDRLQQPHKHAVNSSIGDTRNADLQLDCDMSRISSRVHLGSLEALAIFLLLQNRAGVFMPHSRTAAHVREDPTSRRSPPVALLNKILSKRRATAPGEGFGCNDLSSPLGYEDCYEALRTLHQNKGRPLVHLKELQRENASLAHRLQERVNFNVPKTVGEAMSVFFNHPTPKFIVVAFLCSMAARSLLGVSIGIADLGVSIATMFFWFLQEWLIHDKLLHSGFPWFGETVHRWHHELPYYHVSMDGPGLAATWFSTVAILMLGIGAHTNMLAPSLSALAMYTFCGGLYEASHYLAHTRVPLPRALQRMRQHHTRHHLVSDEYWLAFTVPMVDNIFGTNPDVQSIISRKSEISRRPNRKDRVRRKQSSTAVGRARVDQRNHRMILRTV